jgi:L-ascorbate metabolism protein UlaG (beta-lactamase superfamily)
MGPEEALEAHAILQPLASMPIHYGTFSLADDGESEPVDHLRSLLAERPEQAWRLLEEGQGWTIPTLTATKVLSPTRD